MEKFLKSFAGITGIVAIVECIGFLLPFYSASILGSTYNISFIDTGFTFVIAFIAVIATVAFMFIKLELFALIAAGVNFLIILLRTLLKVTGEAWVDQLVTRSVGCYVLLICSIAILVLSGLNYLKNAKK